MSTKQSTVKLLHVRLERDVFRGCWLLAPTAESSYGTRQQTMQHTYAAIAPLKLGKKTWMADNNTAFWLQNKVYDQN